MRGFARAVIGAALLGWAPPLTTAAGAKALATTANVQVTTPVVNAPDMAGTLATPIRAARFASTWHHAMKDPVDSVGMSKLIGAAKGLSRMQQLAFVQRAVSKQIRWLSDTTLWGQHDYWANADETMAKGAGDMEDRAILKLQALRALGFQPGGLFLTLGHDDVGGAMSVLAVRIDNHYYILTDTGGAPFDVGDRREFHPLLSFQRDAVWLHSGSSAASPRAGSAINRARP